MPGAPARPWRVGVCCVGCRRHPLPLLALLAPAKGSCAELSCTRVSIRVSHYPLTIRLISSFI